MITTDPKLEERKEKPYVGIRTQVTMQELGSDVIPRLHQEVLSWLIQQGTGPAGAPFIRYHVIDMEALLDIELGWPIVNVPAGEGRIRAGVLPAGRYASLIYTGIENGIQGNYALLKWAEEQGLVLDKWETEKGDAFGSRAEFFLTNPADEPDPTKWETEVAIRLADKQ